MRTFLKSSSRNVWMVLALTVFASLPAGSASAQTTIDVLGLLPAQPGGTKGYSFYTRLDVFVGLNQGLNRVGVCVVGTWSRCAEVGCPTGILGTGTTAGVGQWLSSDRLTSDLLVNTTPDGKVTEDHVRVVTSTNGGDASCGTIIMKPLIQNGFAVEIRTYQGDDQVVGGSSITRVWAGSGRDKVTTYACGRIEGEGGDDWLVAEGTCTSNVMNGGDGNDCLDDANNEAGTYTCGAGGDRVEYNDGAMLFARGLCSGDCEGTITQCKFIKATDGAVSLRP